MTSSVSYGLLNRSPGPSAYYEKALPSQFGAKSKGFSFSGKPRAIIDRAKAAEPDPTKYSTTKSTLAGAKFSFGARFRRPRAEDSMPGPGAYGKELKSTIGGPKYSLSGRNRQLRSDTNAVGPGKYFSQIPTSLGGPKIGFGSRLRVKGSTENVPGPGSYAPEKADKIAYGEGPKPSLSSRHREIEIKDIKQFPGPGSYGAKSTIETKKGAHFGRRYRDGIAYGFWAQDGKFKA
jgi:hypothetical protein